MPCAARYFDGLSAMPGHGVLSVEDGHLVFAAPDRDPVRVPVSALAPPRDVASEVVLEVRSRDTSRPSPQWRVDRAEFDALIAPRLRQVRAGFGLRIPVWGWILLCLVVLPLAFVATLRVAEAGHVLVPREREKALGDAVYAALARHAIPCTDAALSNAVNRIARELAEPGSPYVPEVSVWIDGDPNAFALPGGRIVVFTGLLPMVEGTDGLAGVLAHEIAHVEQRHTLKQILRTAGLMHFSSAVVGGSFEGLDWIEQASELTSLLALLKYSRDMESEADRLAVAKLHRLRHTVRGMETFFTNLDRKFADMKKMEKSLAWLSSHPVTGDRRDFLAARAREEAFQPRRWDFPAINWRSPPCSLLEPPPPSRTVTPESPAANE